MSGSALPSAPGHRSRRKRSRIPTRLPASTASAASGSSSSPVGSPTAASESPTRPDEEPASPNRCHASRPPAPHRSSRFPHVVRPLAGVHAEEAGRTARPKAHGEEVYASLVAHAHGPGHAPHDCGPRMPGKEPGRPVRQIEQEVHAPIGEHPMEPGRLRPAPEGPVALHQGLQRGMRAVLPVPQGRSPVRVDEHAEMMGVRIFMAPSGASFHDEE